MDAFQLSSTRALAEASTPGQAGTSNIAALFSAVNQLVVPAFDDPTAFGEEEYELDDASDSETDMDTDGLESEAESELTEDSSSDDDDVAMPDVSAVADMPALMDNEAVDPYLERL